MAKREGLRTSATLTDDLPADVVRAASQRFFTALGEDAREFIARINADEAFLQMLVIFVRANSIKLSTSESRARKIMGQNFLGVEQAIAHFKVKPSKEERVLLSKVPFSEKTLVGCKDTHVLVAVFPLTILQIRHMVGRKRFSDVNTTGPWYQEQMFAQEASEACWHLVRKTPIKGSMNKTWADQHKLIGLNNKMPNVRTMIYTIFLYFLSTGIHLFETTLVRCSENFIPYDYCSHGLFGDHVCLGLFTEEGESNQYYDGWDYGGLRLCKDERDSAEYPDLGLASEVRAPG